MLGVENRFQEFFVAPHAAAILGWAGAFAGDAERIALAGFAGQDLLDGDFVVPRVTEVVKQIETQAFRGDDVRERNGKLVLRAVHLKSRIGIIHAVDRELMEVAVRPTHRGLQNEVQVAQSGVGRNEQAAPDLGIYLQQGDLQLIDCVSFARVLGAGRLSAPEGSGGGNHAQLGRSGVADAATASGNRR